MAVAVGGGAIGSHVIAGRFPADDLARYETAVRYAACHGLGLALLGAVAAVRRHWLHLVVASLFLFGSVFFSGALVGRLFMEETSWIRRLPPYGGSALILGWLLFAVAALLAKPSGEV